MRFVGLLWKTDRLSFGFFHGSRKLCFRYASYLKQRFSISAGLVRYCDKKIYKEDGKLKLLFPLGKITLHQFPAGQDDAVEKLVSDYINFIVGGIGLVLEFYVIYSMKKALKNFSLNFRYKKIKPKQTGTKAFNIQACEEIVQIPQKTN